jgi:hypothetical protein
VQGSERSCLLLLLLLLLKLLEPLQLLQLLKLLQQDLCLRWRSRQRGQEGLQLCCILRLRHRPPRLHFRLLRQRQAGRALLLLLLRRRLQAAMPIDMVP